MREWGVPKPLKTIVISVKIALGFLHVPCGSQQCHFKNLYKAELQKHVITLKLQALNLKFQAIYQSRKHFVKESLSKRWQHSLSWLYVLMFDFN